MAVSIPTGAEENAESAPTATDQASDEATAVAVAKAAPVETEVVEGPIAPPAGYEVIKIKGRVVSGIETDVPESVTQFDAEAIAALGAGSIADLAKVTPNVEIRVAGATAATFFIRGVGLSDFSANAAGAVAIYQDDVVMNTPAIQLGQLFDLRTVDIIRGPAGIGSHRNASAGAIKLYGNKPTAEYEARLKQSFGTFLSNDARDAFIRDTEGYINLPVIDEMMAMRVAFRVRDQAPHMTNGCGNAPRFEDRDPSLRGPDDGLEDRPGAVCSEGSNLVSRPNRTFVSAIPENLPRKVGGKGDWAARGGLRFQPPGTDMDWLVSFHGSRLDQDSTLGQSYGVGETADTPGQINRKGYLEPDIREEFNEYNFEATGVDNLEEYRLVPTAERRDVEAETFEKLGKKLAERPLDRNPYRGDYNRVGKTTLDIWGGNLRGEFSLGRVDVTTITGVESYKRFRDSDRDFSPDSQFEAISRDEAKQFTQEFKLSGRLFDSAVRWNLGGSFIEEQLDASVSNFIRTTDITHPSGLGSRISRISIDQDTTAFMTYGDFTWDFLDDFSLELGVRLNAENKDFGIQQKNFFPTSSFSTPLIEDSGRWREPTGKIGLSYHVSDSVTFHAQYTRGYKAGHFNSNNANDSSAADPEFIDSFEWSLNLNLLEGRIISRAGFFYYKYKDYQVFIFVDDPNPGNFPSLVIVNASRVQQYGSEFDLSLKPLKDWVPEPLDGLTIDLRFGWLASQFLEFTNIDFRNVGVSGGRLPVVTEYSGNRLINSPEFKVSGTVVWPFDLDEWGKITPRYDATWVSETYFDAAEGRGTPGFDRITNEPVTRFPKNTLGQPAYWIHNLRLSYQTPMGNVEVAGWVRNVLDKRYKTYAFDVSLFAGAVINFVGDPRSVGGDVTITW